MKLVDNWKDAPKWISVRCMLIVQALLGTWTMLPESLQAAVPPSVLVGIVSVILALGTLGRVIDQSGEK